MVRPKAPARIAGWALSAVPRSVVGRPRWRRSSDRRVGRETAVEVARVLGRLARRVGNSFSLPRASSVTYKVPTHLQGVAHVVNARGPCKGRPEGCTAIRVTRSGRWKPIGHPGRAATVHRDDSGPRDHRPSSVAGMSRSGQQRINAWSTACHATRQRGNTETGPAKVVHSESRARRPQHQRKPGGQPDISPSCPLLMWTTSWDNGQPSPRCPRTVHKGKWRTVERRPRVRGPAIPPAVGVAR